MTGDVYVLDVTCPLCQRGPDQGCVTLNTTWPTRTHAARHAAARCDHERFDVISLVLVCAECGHILGAVSPAGTPAESAL